MIQDNNLNIYQNISVIDTNVSNKDSLTEEIILSQDTLINNLDFNTYVVKTLNENLPPLNERKTLFKEKTHKPNKYLNIVTRNNLARDYDWIFCVLIIILIVYIIMLKSFPKRLKQILSGCFSTKKAIWYLKDSSLINEVVLLPLLFIFTPVISLITIGFMNHYSFYEYLPIKSHFLVFGLIYISLIAFLGLKFLLIIFFGNLFKCENITSKYLVNKVSYYILIGVVLAPLTLAIFYAPIEIQNTVLIIASSLLAMLILISLMRGLIISINISRLSSIYLFLYLCMLEILPFLLVIKALL